MVCLLLSPSLGNRERPQEPNPWSIEHLNYVSKFEQRQRQRVTDGYCELHPKTWRQWIFLTEFDA